MPGTFTKEQVMHALSELPDDATVADATECLVILGKIEEGLDEIQRGEVISHEEVARLLASVVRGKATARFTVTLWKPAEADQPAEGPHPAEGPQPAEGPTLSRIAISKALEGDIEGESVGQGLFCGMSDPASGAGYVVSERVTGLLDGRQGSFVIQHGGLMGPYMSPETFGNVVPGSGTGELVGLAGTVEISKTDDGQHTLMLRYTITPGQ